MRHQMVMIEEVLTINKVDQRMQVLTYDRISSSGAVSYFPPVEIVCPCPRM